MPALLAGGGVERVHARGLAVEAVVHVGPEDDGVVDDERRRLDLGRVVVVTGPSDLVASSAACPSLVRSAYIVLPLAKYTVGTPSTSATAADDTIWPA